jgi:hypothetical protein
VYVLWAVDGNEWMNCIWIYGLKRVKLQSAGFCWLEVCALCEMKMYYAWIYNIDDSMRGEKMYVERMGEAPPPQAGASGTVAQDLWGDQ